MPAPHRPLSPGATASFVALFGFGGAAHAQSNQTLTLTFDAASAVPIGPWTSVAIALLVAGIALAVLRRRGASRFAQLCLLAATGGALMLAQPLRDAGANGAYIFTSNPFTLSPVTCPLAQNDLIFQNGTGAATTIRGVTLTGVGACSLSGAPGVPNGPAAVPVPACVAGQVIANGSQCYVRVYNIAT